MRIAFVMNNLSGGGAERVAVNVANSMAMMGHDLTLVLSRKQGPYLSEVSDNVRILSLGRRMALAMPSLTKLLRREKFDAVLTILDQPSIACLLIKPLLGKTRVIVVECNNPLASASAVRSLTWRIIRGLRPLLYPRADHIVTKSERIRTTLMEHFNCKSEKVTAISNPVDMARIDTLIDEPIEHRWFEAREAPVCVAMGRLSIQKGFDVLLKAFAQLLQSRDARLIILGEGKERPKLEELVDALGIADRVELRGFVPNPYAYVSHADCFVMSSRWEGWPNALVEALACGTPPVSTDCESGPREILEDGAYGLLVPVDNAEALAAAISTSLEASHDRQRLRARVVEFSPETIAQKYISAVKESLTS